VDDASDHAPSGLLVETPTAPESLQDAVATLANSVTAALSLDDAKPASEEASCAVPPLVQLLQLCNQSVRHNPSTNEMSSCRLKNCSSPRMFVNMDVLPTVTSCSIAKS
jgi:hypothetical protein